MSEFKFTCPNCQQNIQATSEYSGLQINCPGCQTLLVVPAAPDAPAAAPAPHGPRLATSASAPQSHAGAAAAAAFYERQPVRKKKSHTNLIAGLSLGAIAIVAVIFFWPTLKKQFMHGGPSAADQALTNAPPPPPPELTTEEILQKVADSYKGLTDYAAKAQTVGTIDMTAFHRPGVTTENLSTSSSLQLGRTNYYRLEWERKISGQTVNGAAWSAGKGNFVGYGPYPPAKVKTRQLAMAPAASAFVLSSGIAELFFSDTNSVAEDAKNFTKTNDSNVNGQDCYILIGEVQHQSVEVWVNKATFLISQIELTLGFKIDEAELKKLHSTERNMLTYESKLKGSITETYDNIQTNHNLLASAFESSYKPVGNPNAPRQQRPQRPHASSMAGQLTNPRRQQ